MEHFYKTVPGFAAFTELYSRVVREAPQRARFVEVGSWLGKSAAFMAVEIENSGKDIKFFCVDPWENGGPELAGHRQLLDLGSVSVFDAFVKNTRPVAHRISMVRMPSVEAATKFDDGSLDFVMIDGAHDYDNVRADIDAWLPKMKRGAIIAGDDYLWPGVKRAADETFGRGLVPVIKKQTPKYQNSVAHWWAVVR